MRYVTVKLCMPNQYVHEQGKRGTEEKRQKIPQGGLFFCQLWRNSSCYDEVTRMPFYELHPLSYTILCYTKGDLFSMLYGSFSILYGSFLNIQTLSPKVSLVIIRKEKRQQALQQKIKCLDLFSVSFFILFQNYALFQEAETGLFFGKISSYKNSHQTNMHLIMHI